MSAVRPKYDDEFNLFELFQTLWDGKWLISASVAIAVLIGSGFILLKGEAYESKLIYYVDTTPPFYKKDRVFSDLQKKFYSVSVFDNWKKDRGNVSLVFSDFADTAVVDGFLFSKNKGERLASFASEKNGKSFVLVKSNQLPVLDDFFEYVVYINGLLKAEYIGRAKDELIIFKTRFRDFPTAKDEAFSEFLAMDRYIALAETGANVFTIERPTMPKDVSNKSALILVMALVLGGMVGVFFVLVRNEIAKHREQLAKA